MVVTINCDLESLREKLLRLTFVYGYQCGRFVLSSGRTSSYYIDGKQVTMSPDGLAATAAFMIASLRKNKIPADAAGGLTLGADSIAAAVAVLSRNKEGLAPLSCFIVRKEQKGHGTRSRIEGPFYSGIRAVIVDDVLTTGASILSAAKAVEEAGGRVAAGYVLADRMEGGYEAVTAAGYPLEAIITRAELEALQQRLEKRYPLLFASLQQEAVDWRSVPWAETAATDPGLHARLERLTNRLGRIRPDESGKVFSAAAAREVLRAVKAVELLPDGKEEALKILARVEQYPG